MMINVKMGIRHILAYLICIFIIMSGAVMYNYVTNTKVSPSLWKYLLMLCFSLTIFCYRMISSRTIKETVALFVYLLAYAILAILFSDPIINSLITFVFGFTLSYMYVREVIMHDDYIYLMNAFANVMLFITILSLFFWFFGSQLNIIPCSRIGYTYGGGTVAHNYYWLYFDEPVQNTIFFGHKLIRNCGICTEAPGFANYLMYGLAIELIRKDSKKWRIMIFMFGLITNFSSKSYIILAIALLFILYKLVMINGIFKQKIMMLICMAPFVFSIFGWAVYSIIIDKATNSVGSYNGRINSLQHAISAWRNHPLLGAGIANYSVIQSGSMGITLLLAQCGLCIMIVYVIAIICALKTEVLIEYKWGIYLFISLFIANFFISNIGTSTLTLLTIASGLAVYSLYGKNVSTTSLRRKMIWLN